jgi:hypothetical protein
MQARRHHKQIHAIEGRSDEVVQLAPGTACTSGWD